MTRAERSQHDPEGLSLTKRQKTKSSARNHRNPKHPSSFSFFEIRAFRQEMGNLSNVSAPKCTLDMKHVKQRWTLHPEPNLQYECSSACSIGAMTPARWLAQLNLASLFEALEDPSSQWPRVCDVLSLISICSHHHFRID